MATDGAEAGSGDARQRERRGPAPAPSGPTCSTQNPKGLRKRVHSGECRSGSVRPPVPIAQGDDARSPALQGARPSARGPGGRVRSLHDRQAGRFWDTSAIGASCDASGTVRRRRRTVHPGTGLVRWSGAGPAGTRGSLPGRAGPCRSPMRLLRIKSRAPCREGNGAGREGQERGRRGKPRRRPPSRPSRGGSRSFGGPRDPGGRKPRGPASSLVHGQAAIPKDRHPPRRRPPLRMAGPGSEVASGSRAGPFPGPRPW